MARLEVFFLKINKTTNVGFYLDKLTCYKQRNI